MLPSLLNFAKIGRVEKHPILPLPSSNGTTQCLSERLYRVTLAWPHEPGYEAFYKLVKTLAGYLPFTFDFGGLTVAPLHVDQSLYTSLQCR
ncbi:hypothetical protein GOP47_0011571 [Adiantum capillus-veneris]|uniref:Uncharacterized protein n=1 Tax=Adiantum capillus-veneris TaxID=13818 RepID=A0A9D4UT16_ADICA|nr:hypothetical protein GOP47_0011571 [Adiantum capillus-veneris]